MKYWILSAPVKMITGFPHYNLVTYTDFQKANQPCIPQKSPLGGGGRVFLRIWLREFVLGWVEGHRGHLPSMCVALAQSTAPRKEKEKFVDEGEKGTRLHFLSLWYRCVAGFHSGEWGVLLPLQLFWDISVTSSPILAQVNEPASPSAFLVGLFSTVSQFL
jgi:hypothetical protein